MIPKTPRLKSKKIIDSAKGEKCTLRISPNCTDEWGAVVLCHIGKIKGTASKCHDTFSVYGCNHCHDLIDGRVKPNKNYDSDKLRAVEETQNRFIQQGLMRV